MNTLLDKYGRLSVDVASAATSIGFAAAKAGTKLGFGITRGIAATAAGVTGSAVDYALFGGKLGTGVAFGNAVSSVITAVERLTLLPILFGESLTSASIVAAYGSINSLLAIFPDSDEASFSLASFITLVRREWNDPVFREHLPEERYSVTEVAKALVAWGALQGVTHDWQANKWMKHLQEIPFHDEAEVDRSRKRTESRVSITADVIFPGNKGQIITADIIEVDTNMPAPQLRSKARARPTKSPAMKPLRVSNKELKHTLRRLSKMVLAGYGGASLLFFGVSPTPDHAPSSAPKDAINAHSSGEEATLAHAIDASEFEAAKTSPHSSSTAPASGPTKVQAPAPYSWWNLLLGRHDHDIFMGSASPPGELSSRPITAVIGDENHMPRFWVLTDHARRQIVLVFRGTMSLNELAVDLTCEPEEFEVATTSGYEPEEEYMPQREQEGEGMPGGLPFPTVNMQMPPPSPYSSWRSSKGRASSFMSVASFASAGQPRYYVHSGMLKMARAMGEKGKPVHVASQLTIFRERKLTIELVMCGHSLGSGVAALLGLMWADPKTCLTVRSSGLPIGRRVSVYCFAPPCLTDPHLGALASNLVTSFVYSHDVVSRLSLGSIRDMNRAAVWLCDANANAGAKGNGREEGYAAVTKRALKWKTGFGSPEDPFWFLATRKTLEANMTMTNMYPPGRVLWAVRNDDFEVAVPPSGDAKYSPNFTYQSQDKDRLRLFEVLDTEKVFSQIVFARDMLSSHLPHQYDKVLEELL
ncbi:hypothetical protein EW146_g2664 [Bondarzewia mesenterica]|uniref:sn-1-specific diacylglycerol lipase n=1 Tax=Bondarzewia mesenterica TaxID=1095465 RepID=A0A4S4M278_9AGAM|nr:hypothetical protein EW146_g2664 [Bondarzewia mesenterica]